MTTEPTETPEVETPPPPIEPSAAPVSPPPVRPVRRFYGAQAPRVAMFIVAAVLIFAGGFVAGHWVFERHDHDRRPDFSARAQRFLQGMQNQRGGQSRNGPQMGQAPNLQQLLPLIEGLLNNRGSAGRSPASGSDDVQRQIQQLQQQVKQLQDQLKNAPTPTTR